MKMASEEITPEMQGCGLCSHEYPIETMTMNGDLWLCPQCEGQWQEHFATCQHQWVDGDHDGEKGKYCEKCTGFVEESDFKAMFPDALAVSNGDRE